MNARIASICFVTLVLALAACPGKGTPPPNPPTELPARHAACAAGQCAAGLTCVSFVGVTGQALDSCEIPCVDGACGNGETCSGGPDGPQDVCKEATGDGGGTGAKQGEACPTGACDAGLACIDYYGIAGANGPKFTSCEITCKGKTACPGGQSCVTIADGPGEVCRPTAP